MYISKLLVKDNDILNAKRVFLEYLVKGTMNLYYYRDKNKDEHYYVEKDNIGLKELIEEKKEGYKDGRIVIITNKKYKGVLMIMISNCLDLQPVVDNTELNHKSLIKLARKYNECLCSDCEIFVKPKPWATFKIGVFTGVNYSFINFKTPPVTNIESNFSGNLSFLCGLGANIILPRLNEKLSFQFELFYLRHYYKSYSEVNNYNTDFGLYAYYLKNPIMLRYTFPNWKIRPFITIGVSNTFIIRTNYLLLQAYKQNNNEIIIQEYYDLPLNNFQMIFLGGIGFQYNISKRISLFMEFRYETGNNLLNGKINNYSLLTGITF